MLLHVLRQKVISIELSNRLLLLPIAVISVIIILRYFLLIVNLCIALQKIKIDMRNGDILHLIISFIYKTCLCLAKN